MARLNLRSNTKFLRLCRDLKRPTYQVRGLLEQFWDSANENAPRFRELDDVELAAGWDGEVGTFGGALVSCGLLDHCADGYMVHDYEANRPGWVKDRDAKRAIRAQRAAEKQHHNNATADSVLDAAGSVTATAEEEKRRDETYLYIPPAEAGGIDIPCPLKAHPKLAKFLPGIREAIRAAHPKAKLPAEGSKAELGDRQNLERLIRLDGYTEAAVIHTLRWVLRHESAQADFWRQQFRSLSQLRKVTDGATKFTKIHDAMLRDDSWPQIDEGEGGDA